MNDPFALAIQLMQARGVETLPDLPDKTFETTFDVWHLAINGNRTPRNLGPDIWKVDVPGYHICVWFNGWLAGFMNACGSTLCAGEVANIDTLCEAMREEINSALEEVSQ